MTRKHIAQERGVGGLRSSLYLLCRLNKPHVDFQVYCDVEPKRQALTQTNLDLAAATEKLEAVRRKLVVSVT